MFKKYKKLTKKTNKNNIDLELNVDHEEVITSCLEKTEKRFKEIFTNCSDVIFQSYAIENKHFLLIYVEGFIDKMMLNENVLENILQSDQENPSIKQALPIGQVKTETHLLLIIDELLSGSAILLQEGFQEAIILGIKAFHTRDVSESQNEPVIRGPREAFTEEIGSNISLVRRIIRSPRLKVEGMKIGTLTQTDVNILYVEGIINPYLIEEVRERLSRIRIDGVLETAYIEEFIEDDSFSPFPQIQYTERPDMASLYLLRGKIAVLVNGTPNVLIVPTTLSSLIQAPEDYYERALYSSAIRLVRVIFFLVSLVLPPLYIAITTFHPEMLPTELLISISGAREGVPFPALIEALIMELAFEILREAGIRLPRQVGPAVSIVGALVIGQAAIQAQIVSPLMVIIVATTAIASFAVPAYNLSYALRILKYFLMFISAIFGLFGIIWAFLLVSIHLCRLKSFGIPYLAGIAPFIAKDQKDNLIRTPHWSLTERPLANKPVDATGQPKSNKLKQFYFQLQEEE